MNCNAIGETRGAKLSRFVSIENCVTLALLKSITYKHRLSKGSIIYYHLLYSILDFHWLIHLQITACKYRSAANNWCKYLIEYALKMLRQLQ